MCFSYYVCVVKGQYMSVEVHVIEDNVVSGCICVSEVAAYLVHLHGARERE